VATNAVAGGTVSLCSDVQHRMRTVIHRGRRHLVASLVAGALALTSCSDATTSGNTSTAPVASDPTASEPVSATSAPESTLPEVATTVLTPTTTAESSPPSTAEGDQRVAVVEVLDGVEAYPACGNEPFTYRGVTWYPIAHVGFDPFDPRLKDRLERVLGVERNMPDTPRVSQFARVPAPAPGDDVGTLIVWEDGVGRWTSDSGALDVWVTVEEVTYSWVC
jgi:hypothetical protein